MINTNYVFKKAFFPSAGKFLIACISLVCFSVDARSLNSFYRDLQEAQCNEIKTFEENSKKTHVFQCKTTYPATPITSDVIAKLRGEGWLEKKSDISEWETFRDMSTGTLRIVRQRTYLFKRKREVIEVSLRQVSASEQPKNDADQILNVTVYSD